MKHWYVYGIIFTLISCGTIFAQGEDIEMGYHKRTKLASNFFLKQALRKASFLTGCGKLPYYLPVQNNEQVNETSVYGEKAQRHSSQLPQKQHKFYNPQKQKSAAYHINSRYAKSDALELTEEVLGSETWEFLCMRYGLQK